MPRRRPTRSRAGTIFCDDGGGGGTGDSSSGGADCELVKSCNVWDGVPSWDEDDCNIPLMFSFDGRPAELVPACASTFDEAVDAYSGDLRDDVSAMPVIEDVKSA